MPPNSVQNPLFRKMILPWYDTDAICILAGVAMLIVFVFSFIGILVALEAPENYRHIWVPSTLLIMSVVVIASIVFRLIRRRVH